MLLYVDVNPTSNNALTSSIESLTPHPPHDGDESPISSSPPTPHTPLNRSSSHSSDDAPHRPMPQHLDSRSPMIPKRLHVRDSFKGIDSESNCRKQRDSLEGLNATLGLVIHGAADGIALGASSRSGSGSLGLIVFMAVLVHKGGSSVRAVHAQGRWLIRRTYRAGPDHHAAFFGLDTAKDQAAACHLFVRRAARSYHNIPHCRCVWLVYIRPRTGAR